ncbi:MAG: hypothetical protein WKG00_38270 [Polyangiaceae bacterium]
MYGSSVARVGVAICALKMSTVPNFPRAVREASTLLRAASQETTRTFGMQSSSLPGKQPSGQQPSSPLQATTAVKGQTTSQLSALPWSFCEVQRSTSMHSVGQSPSHVSPPST